MERYLKAFGKPLPAPDHNFTIPAGALAVNFRRRHENRATFTIILLWRNNCLYISYLTMYFDLP
jgi:hypothetical protein